jgi:ketosteroid isomerase-like protein
MLSVDASGIVGQAMMMGREETLGLIGRWNEAWNRHDLDTVMELFHDDVEFDNWTGGRVNGKQALRQAWAPWFRNHGGFRFTTEDLFVDETAERVLFRWSLDWPSMEKGHEGRPERRRGVDVIHLRDGLIIGKYTYSKTALEISGERVKLCATGL